MTIRTLSSVLVTNIMAMAPMSKTKFLRAMEADEPTADLICVASAVKRDITSPERVTS